MQPIVKQYSLFCTEPLSKYKIPTKILRPAQGDKQSEGVGKAKAIFSAFGVIVTLSMAKGIRKHVALKVAQNILVDGDRYTLIT